MKLARMIVVTAALLAAPAAAQAATPESGKLTADKPVVTWSGEAASFPLTLTNLLLELRPCETSTGTCDEFTLDLATQDKLTIYARSSALTQMEVEEPDGTRTFQMSGAANGDPEQMVFPNAKPGQYVVRIWQNAPAATSYTGRAALGAWGDDPTLDPEQVQPEPPKPEEPKPQPAPSQPAPQPQPQPAPTEQPAPAAAPAPAPAITVGTRTAKARGKRLAIKLSSTGALRDVKATLARGKTAVARGMLGSLDASGTLRLTSKRALRPGTYRLVVVGVSASGAKVATAVTVVLTR